MCMVSDDGVINRSLITHFHLLFVFVRLYCTARGLGFTQTKGETEYVRWETVDKPLSDLSFPTSWENGNPHDYYIPENIFYLTH